MTFAHLHLHTEYSLLDGLTRIPDLVKKCRATGMSSVAITDHGNMLGIMRLVAACADPKIGDGQVKPIIGCEVYVAPRSRMDRKLNVRQPEADGLEDCLDPSGHRDAGYHLVLLAKNQTGFANLSKLVSKGFTEGFYYKPRVDKELLREYSEGLIALSACLGGEVQARLMNGSFESAERVAMEYRDIFGEDFFLEIQNQGLEQERLIIPLQERLSAKTGIPLVATNDSHYLNHDDSDLHDTLLCIGTKKLKSDQRRMRFPTDQFFVKSPEEMALVFPRNPEYLERTVEIASRIDFLKMKRDVATPYFPGPGGIGMEDHFRATAKEWFERRMIDLAPLWHEGLLKYSQDDYRNRFAFEIDMILKMGFPGYFLLVWDFIAKAREMGVPVGPGRGSAAGSIVAWALKITDIDPMQYELLFERFLNPERVSMPDVDIDFCRDGRQRVIEYVTERYGRDKVCNIVTINQFKTKAAIKDVARVYERDFNWSNELTKLIPSISPDPDKKINIANCLEWTDKLRERYESEPDVKMILDVAARLEGVARNTGVHAAGIIIAPDELTKFAPLIKDKDDKVMVQYTMNDVEPAGLLKMDFLGLETLTQIEKIQSYIAKTEGEPVDMAKVDRFDDPKTFELFSAGDTDGVFQFESPGMKNLLRSLKPDRFDDLIALNALFRPGPLGAKMDEIYVNRRHGREIVDYPFPVLKPILESSYGVILYQEQVMQIAQAIAGFSLGEADMLRRAMGKKDADKMKKEKEGFIARGKANGFDPDGVAKLFDTIEFFAGYGFNRSHSAAYAMVAYRTAYLKANHRVEFMAGLLSTKSQRTDDVIKYVRNCREIGIEILGPDINKSDLDFTITGDSQIRFGLAAVKGLGDAALCAILDARKREGQFRDLRHAIASSGSQKVNKKAWECLIKAGAFDSLHPNRAALLAGLQSAMDKSSTRVNAEEVSMFDEEDMALLSEPWSAPSDVEPFSNIEGLRLERETLGMYVTGHPLFGYADVARLHATMSISELKLAAQAGRIKDRDVVTLAVLVTGQTVKMSQKGDKFGILQVEDTEDSMEALLMASHYNPATKQRTRPFDLYSGMATSDSAILMTGEIKVETASGALDDESEEEEKISVKMFVSRIEPISDYAWDGRGALLVTLPNGECLRDMIGIINAHPGDLPVYIDYKSVDVAMTARVRAGASVMVANDDDVIRDLERIACRAKWVV
jgi:DNA polymerase-3 subunit alpha